MCTLWSDDAEKHVVRVKSLAPEANYSKKKKKTYVYYSVYEN